MRAIVGVVIGALSATLMWRAATFGASNLPHGQRGALVLCLTLVAGGCGLLAALLIESRPTRPNSVLFSATAGGVCSAVCGAAYAVALLFAYVHSYGGSPSGLLDEVLLVLAYPVFALLGALVGGCVGAGIGAIAGLTARRLA